MHKIVYQVCSPLVISARPNSDSAFLAGTFLRYMAPRAMLPKRYQNRSAEVKPAVPVDSACGGGWKPCGSYCCGTSGWASGGVHCCGTWVWSTGARGCGALRPDSCGGDSDIAISLTFGDVD